MAAASIGSICRRVRRGRSPAIPGRTNSGTFSEENAWRDRFAVVPYEDKGGSHPIRYYQDIAVERLMQAIAGGLMRILLTLATGTGKTFIAFQIAWKLFHARWNLSREAKRRPGILFLTERGHLRFTIYAFVKAHLNLQDPEWDRRRRKNHAPSAASVRAPAR